MHSNWCSPNCCTDTFSGMCITVTFIEKSCASPSPHHIYRTCIIMRKLLLVKYFHGYPWIDPRKLNHKSLYTSNNENCSHYHIHVKMGPLCYSKPINGLLHHKGVLSSALTPYQLSQSESSSLTSGTANKHVPFSLASVWWRYLSFQQHICCECFLASLNKQALTAAFRMSW